MVLGWSWEGPRRFLDVSSRDLGGQPKRTERKGGNPASRDVPIIFKTERGHQNGHGGGACRRQLDMCFYKINYNFDNSKKNCYLQNEMVRIRSHYT